MTSSEFVYWVKGYLTAQTDSQFKIDIEKALDQVQDYDDNPGISWEIEEPKNWWDNTAGMPLTGTISGSQGIVLTTDSSGSFRYSTTIWNDQMGCWHYTNYPEGFGYYTNSTVEGKKQKQQLND
jgi:hypothetical protein